MSRQVLRQEPVEQTGERTQFARLRQYRL